MDKSQGFQDKDNLNSSLHSTISLLRKLPKVSVTSGYTYQIELIVGVGLLQNSRHRIDTERK
jgi:hypothetical protein